MPMAMDKPVLRLDLKDIADGKHDDKLARLAKGAAGFGEKHGGYFVTTMEEMNGYWYPWSQNQNYIPAWQHIWQVFEDQGANKYVTWVWEPFCLEPNKRMGDLYKLQSPGKYYPGDKYVDWIGFSAFSRRRGSGDGMRHRDLISRSLEEMHTAHKDKPIIHAETGRTQGYNQEEWLNDAFWTIKREMPELKAVIYWDNITLDLGDDKTLSKDSLHLMKEIFRDPYWIMARDV
jgi:beta-mannanase